jgi:predicted Rossmann fold flavoprotein
LHACDVVVIGAGAAGMMCAAVFGQRGQKVVLIDHAQRIGEKIRISGGGRCNFTNVGTTAANFVSDNPAFCRSALSRYTPGDFIALVKRHGIAFHEKHRGQLFCDGPSEQIIAMLRAECDAGAVSWRHPCTVNEIVPLASGYRIEAGGGPLTCSRVVIATGGLPIPKIGASDFGLRIARKFGVPIIETGAALVPLVFDVPSWQAMVSLSGLSLPVDISVHAPGARKAASFHEDLLFTHRGLSGPAILQISTYWRDAQQLLINLAPGIHVADELATAKASSRQTISNVLQNWLPRRLAQEWLALASPLGELRDARLAELPDRVIAAIGQAINGWRVVPTGTEGYRKAEVMRGGVDTRALSQQNLEVKSQPGLHFIGEVVDVTGWLGGYNFQWAWASAMAAARGI